MKIAILLPGAEVAWTSRGRALASLLTEAAAFKGRDVTITIGVPEASEAIWRTLERGLREELPEVVIRHLSWESVPVAQARRMFASLETWLDIEGIAEVMVPRDWGWNFNDCDVWLNFADPALGAVLPLRPTLHICTDLAVRVVPSAYAADLTSPYWTKEVDAFRLWRQGTVATSDSHSVEDIVGYAGVRRERVRRMPWLLDGEELALKADAACSANASLGPRSGLLWWVCVSPLHDAAAAVEGWRIYVREGGRLNLTLAIDPPGRTVPHHALELPDGVARVEITSERMLNRLLSTAAIVWSSRVAGGEAEVVRRAAAASAVFVGADYPLHAEEVTRTGVAAVLYRPGDAIAIADALHQAERAAPGASVAASKPGGRSLRLQEVWFLIEELETRG